MFLDDVLPYGVEIGVIPCLLPYGVEIGVIPCPIPYL